MDSENSNRREGLFEREIGYYPDEIELIGDCR